MGPMVAGEFNKVVKLIRDRKLSMYGSSTMMWVLPIEFITAFEDVVILTYLYDASAMSAYLRIHDIPVGRMTLIGGELVPMNGRDHERGIKQQLKENINVYDGSMNKYGNNSKRCKPLSRGWFTRIARENKKVLLELKASTEHFFKTIAKTGASENAWTTFTDCRSKLKGQRYTKGFIPLNARATNEYAHKKSLAYLVNRYPSPVMVGYLRGRGVEFDQDLFALSEMLQWIWRSAIRNGEPISISRLNVCAPC